MAETSNTINASAFAEAMLRLQRSAAKIPRTGNWRWILFDHDLKTNVMAGRGTTGPTVTLGLPWHSPQCCLNWIEPRLFFWPRGVPSQRRVSIISSRLKQRLDEESWWFGLLRTAILRSDPAADLFCTVTGTAAHPYVCRAAMLFGRSVLEFHVDSRERCADHDGMIAWITNLSSCTDWDSDVTVADVDQIAEPPAVESYAAGTYWPVFVSQPFFITDNTADDLEITAQNRLSGLPIADRILFAAGECLQVLHVRSNGIIQTLLKQHIQDDERHESIVMLASDAAGQTPPIDSDSANCFVPWLLKSMQSVDQAVNTSSNTAVLRALESSPESTPLSHPGDWLLHWTRSTVGPWPDQNEQEFNDELILGCRSADRSVLATLLRIVNEGRLWASSEAIRGGYRVVSFTEVPLHEFRRRRAYRRHRRRYDFEPWGIAIRRDLLESSGARPVQYGDDETWQRLYESDRPFFQNVGAGDGWTKDEREWRIVEHLKLNDLPQSAVIVFVDTKAAREIIQSQTVWPVIIVPQ